MMFRPTQRAHLPPMTSITGSRDAVRRAIVRLAYAEGWEQTVERLDELVTACEEWRSTINHDPVLLSNIEKRAHRDLLKAA